MINLLNFHHVNLRCWQDKYLIIKGISMDGHDHVELELHLRSNFVDIGIESRPDQPHLQFCHETASQLKPGWKSEDLQYSSEIQETQSTRPGHLK